MKNVNIAVIGGGLSGLITAIYLAKAGKSVVVVEKSDRLGGRAMTIHKNGALFNIGGHALYRGGAAFAILKELGVKLEGGSPPTTDGFGIWRNRVVSLPATPLKLLSSRLLSWSGKIELAKLMMKLGKLNVNDIAAVSLRDWAEKEMNNPMVRHIFYSLCRTATYTSDPDHQLAYVVLEQVQSSLKCGVLYLDGGWQSIVDQLQVQATQLGVSLLHHKNVVEIEHIGGIVQKIVLADGEKIDVESVVSTLAPTEMQKLIRNADSASLQRWKEEVRPVTTACLDLCLKRLPNPNLHFAMGLDLPIFFTHQSRVAKLSENGGLVMHLIKYHSFGESDPKADERMLEQTMSLLHPGWQKEVMARQFLPNIAVARDYLHTEKKGAFPGPSVPEIHGLYIAGDWASHGEMLADAAAASAKRAALQVLQQSKVFESPFH